MAENEKKATGTKDEYGFMGIKRDLRKFREQWDLSKKSTPEKVLRALLFNPASVLSLPKNIKHIKNAFIAVKNDDSDNPLLKKAHNAIRKEGDDYSWLTFKKGGAIKKAKGGIVQVQKFSRGGTVERPRGVGIAKRGFGRVIR